MNIKLTLFLSPVLLQKASAFPDYAYLIPNGHSVPNPGPQGGVWAGVGHVNAGGGGDRNQFGIDFAAEGHEWTKVLCDIDSDGDGRSNGVELGDPQCEWVAGSGVDPAGPAVSHPGIMDEPQEGVYSTCDDYVEPEQVEFMEIKFSQINEVNETQTHYMCEQYEMDAPVGADEYHLIKSSILLDNPDLLHHMFVYLCPEGVTSSDRDRVNQGPYDCYGRTENNCVRLAGWAVGADDFCMPQQVGMQLDFSGPEKFVVKIEAHYDNTKGVNQTDQSGMKLTITPKLRPLVSGQVILGMTVRDNDFLIPPQADEHILTNICPSEVTSLLEHPVYAFSFAPHMHYYGRKLYTEHWRCGKKIGEIGRIDQYEFNNQQSYGIPKPSKILPGDALVTKCYYNTISEVSPIKGGEETKDEMCLDFVNYYPNGGTEDRPTLFSACLSILNGIQSDNPLFQNIRIATSDRMDLSEDTVVMNFEDDPTKSWAPCCDTGDCEEQYKMLATTGAACGVDNDCAEELCLGGLCSEPAEPGEDPEVTDPSSSSDAETTMWVVAPISAVAVVLLA